MYSPDKLQIAPDSLVLLEIDCWLNNSYYCLTSSVIGKTVHVTPHILDQGRCIIICHQDSNVQSM